MVTLGRIKNNDISIVGEINERLPLVTDGLVAHFPFDGKGGSFSSISGHSTKQCMENGMNLIEAMALDWRDPSSWTTTFDINVQAGIQYIPEIDGLKITGYRPMWLKIPVIVDTNKTYRISLEIYSEVRSTTNKLTYIGGYTLDANRVKTTTNYDYTMASGWDMPKGTWNQLKLTRTGTSVAPYSTSNSFDNVKGWKGNVDAGLITKFYYFGGLFNYQDSTGITYIRNLSIEVVSEDTSNAQEYDDALYIDRPSTNTDPSTIGRCATYNNHSMKESMVDTGEKFLDMPIYKVTFTPTNDTQLYSVRNSLWGQGIAQGWTTFKANTKYSSSIYWKPLSHHNMEFGGTASNAGGFLGGYNEYIGNGWYRYHRYRDGTVTKEVGDSVHHSFRIPDAELNVPITFLYACPQREEGVTHPTPYMKPGTSRGSKVNVEIPGVIPNWNEGCINIKIRPNPGSPVYDLQNNGGLNRILSVVARSDATSVYDGMTVVFNTNGVYAETVNATSDRTTTSTTGIKPLSSNVWHTVTLRWKKGTTFDYSLTVDGVTQSMSVALSKAPTIVGDLIIGDLQGFDRLCSGAYKDLSVYNRYLSDSEVLTLHKGAPFKLESDGNLIVGSINERVIDTDNKVYHFPLLMDTEEVRGRAKALKEENLIYTQEGVFHNRRAVVNYAQYGLYNYEQYYQYTKDGDTHRFFRHAESTSESLYVRVDKLMSELVNGDNYTVSGYLYRNGKPVRLSRKYIHTARQTTSLFITESNGYFASTQKYNSTDENGGWLIGTAILDSVTKGETIEIRNLQITKGDVNVAYHPTTSVASLLAFDLRASIGIDWSSDWSIVYWKKPISTTTTTYTGYSIDSLGASGSTNQGYIWWGKDLSVNTIFTSVPTDITAAQYFNNWRMISVVKNGTLITIKEMDYFGNTHVRTATNNTTNPNRFVNNDGYDLLLGGFNSSGISRADAMFRDLIVAKRAFTDDEISTLFKRQMKLTKSGVIISGILKEGQLH